MRKNDNNDIYAFPFFLIFTTDCCQPKVGQKQRKYAFHRGRSVIFLFVSIDGFKSDIVLWCKLLLPGAVKRIYNLQSKQLIKLFARLLVQDEDEMLEHLEQGDVAETISVFFESSVAVSPCAASVLTIQDVSYNNFMNFENQ